MTTAAEATPNVKAMISIGSPKSVGVGSVGPVVGVSVVVVVVISGIKVVRRNNH